MFCLFKGIYNIKTLHLKVMTATTSPAMVAQALSALSLKDSCAMLPQLINNYTGHYNTTNTR